MNAKVQEYIKAKDIKETDIHKLQRFIKDIFPEADISLEVYQDPEEDWDKLLFDVKTGIDDVEKMMCKEDKYYEILNATNIFDDVTKKSIVSFT